MPTPICLYPACDKFEYTRGLCNNHYNQARRIIAKGLATWESLEKSGKCKCPKKTQIRRSSSWFVTE